MDTIFLDFLHSLACHRTSVSHSSYRAAGIDLVGDRHARIEGITANYHVAKDAAQGLNSDAMMEQPVEGYGNVVI